MSKSHSVKKEIIPLLVYFKQPINQPRKNYSYDELMGLNISNCNGISIPVVFTPGTVAKIKSISKQIGED